MDNILSRLLESEEPAIHSSFMETLVPLRALTLYARMRGRRCWQEMNRHTPAARSAMGAAGRPSRLPSTQEAEE